MILFPRSQTRDLGHPSCCGSRRSGESLGGGRGWWKVGDGFECGDLLGRQVNVVVFAGTEKEAGVAVDCGVVVAAEGEAILKRDAFGGVGGEGKAGQSGEGGKGCEAAMGMLVGHGF